MLYADTAVLLPDVGVNRVVKLHTNHGPLFVHTDVHAVKLGDGMLRVYSFDSFINHSCEPNSIACEERDDGGSFTTIATRALKRDEEITTDYDSFIYDYDGIPVCQCGSVMCRGASFGFRHIPRADKEAMLHRTHPSVVSAWLRETPRIDYYTVTLSSKLKLTSTPSAHINDSKATNVELFVITNAAVVAGDSLLKSCCFSPSCGIISANSNTVFIALNNPWIRKADSTGMCILEPQLGEEKAVLALKLIPPSLLLSPTPCDRESHVSSQLQVVIDTLLPDDSSMVSPHWDGHPQLKFQGAGLNSKHSDKLFGVIVASNDIPPGQVLRISYYTNEQQRNSEKNKS